MTSPVFHGICPVNPFSFKESQYSDVLRHCHTRSHDVPVLSVSLSRTIVVSRWFVIPIAAISSSALIIFTGFYRNTKAYLCRSSSASSSSYPSPVLGILVNSLCHTAHLTFSLNRNTSVTGSSCTHHNAITYLLAYSFPS